MFPTLRRPGEVLPTMTQLIWLLLVIIACLVGGAQAGFLDDIERGICQRKYIRNGPKYMETLRGCKVIEGSLQIALMTGNDTTPEEWTNYSYPDLREITGYFLMFDVYKLKTLRHLFPNLAVIRGQELVDTHALIISGNELQEIGLKSLTNITRGSVWIVDNPHLCYVDTIDWTAITNVTTSDGIAKNKPIDQCPNVCRGSCPKSELDGRHLCWSNSALDCQKVFTGKCPEACPSGPCTDDGRQCCSEQCLGGCTGITPQDCFVCKHVVFNRTCSDVCPPTFYEYLHRRCVTRSECLNIRAIPDISKGGGSDPLTGKLFESGGKKMCVLECPKDTELAPNQTVCVPCEGTCKKNCPGIFVDSIEKARELAGCTRIMGTLKISLRRSSSVSTGQIAKELKENLDKIEQIDYYLVVTHTYAIVSLDFLPNLKVIKGLKLEDERYALVVLSNENLMELWDSRSTPVRIENRNASVLFHYNSKLCPRKITDFVKQSRLKPSAEYGRIDIGVTNGDKVTCNTQVLQVRIEKKTNNSVQIKYENFRRNLTLTSHLLNYEIHYKEAPEYPQRNVSKYDDRDPCGDDGWSILEYAKISDAEVSKAQTSPNSIGIQNEPPWEQTRLISNLKHYAWYALYVKTIVIPDENSLNNNTGAESDIIYFQTLPGIPSPPQEFKLSAKSPNSVVLTWTPPLQPNGKLEKFTVWLKTEHEDQDLQDQRNFCEQRRTVTKGWSTTARSTASPPFPPPPRVTEDVTISTKQKDVDCCSCSAIGGGKGTSSSVDPTSIQYQDTMMNNIMTIVFIPNLDTPANEDPDSNSIRLRKRSIRKRSVEDMSDSSAERLNGDTFPGENNSPGPDPARVPPGMEMIREVYVTPGAVKYTFTLENLTHFTTYNVGIQACRAAQFSSGGGGNSSSDVENETDTRTCSGLKSERIQTSADPAADEVDPKSIQTFIEGNILHLSWTEPSRPNGVILAYNIHITRVEGTKYLDVRCVTRKEFQARKNYTYPVTLQPGNYSVKLVVQSLARESRSTAERYFIIEDIDGGLNGLWALIILLPLLLIIAIGSLLGYYYIRTKGIIERDRIFSANPEYMSNVDIPEQWEVPRKKLVISDNVLGEGSFGKVFEGELKDFIQGCPVMCCAIKSVADDISSEDRALFLKEAALMVKLDCHCYHVVKLLGVVSKTQPTFVIMELMAKGDLKNYLRSRRHGTCHNGEPPPTLRQILRMAAEIADGMAYIHKNKLVHRDLAARNCMVAEDLSVKVGDFGMSKEVIQSDYYRKQTRGLLPVRWMAPESLRDGVFTNQTDVWSFGVVLWEMATLAAQPYQGLGNAQVLEFVQSGRTMERPENCPDILFDLMTLCWRFDYRRRPSFVDILDRLTPDLDPSFAQVSFYHSSDGSLYRAQLRLQTDDELVTIRTPLRATFDAMSDDELDGYDSDEDLHDLNHHIVDDLGDTPNRHLLSSSPPTATISSSTRAAPSLTNGLALNPLNIRPSNSNSSAENINMANHALPAPTTTSSTTTNNPYARSNYSPRPRTNSNNNNTNPRLPISLNFQNSLANSSAGAAQPAGSSSSISSVTYPFTSSIPNGVDAALVAPTANAFQPSTSSPKRLLNPVGGGDSKVEGPTPPSDNSYSLMMNYSSGDGMKISNGSGGNGGGTGGGTGGNGYINRKSSPSENQPVNRTTQC